MMKEKVARLTPPHEAIERTKQGKTKQNKKHTLVWTKIPISRLFGDHHQ
jgi:hypothetical protein